MNRPWAKRFLILGICVITTGCAQAGKPRLPCDVAARVALLTESLSDSHGVQAMKAPSKYEAALELGKIGLEWALPQATVTALEKAQSDDALASLAAIDTAAMGSGLMQIRQGDGARIAFMMWDLREIRSEAEKAEYLWKRLMETGLGDGAMSFCIDSLCSMKSEVAIPYLAATASQDGATYFWLVRRKAAARLGAFFPLTRDVLFLLTSSSDVVVAQIAQDALEEGGLAAAGPGTSENAQTLLSMLRDQDWVKRRIAAAALGGLGGQEGVVSLIGALEDKDRLVRQAAAAALGKIGDKRAAEPLTKVLKTDRCWLVRSTAVLALQDVQESTPPAVLLGLLNDKDPRVRRAAMIVACGLDAEEAAEILLRAMNDCDADVRFPAVNAMSSALPSAWAVEGLLHALADPEDMIVATAAIDLGKARERRAVEPLIRLLKPQRALLDTWLTAYVAEALGHIRDPRAVDALVAALANEAEDVRKAAAKALGEIGDKRAVPHLSKVAKDDNDQSVRQAATESLQELQKVP